MLINELLWVIFLVGFGACVGWTVRDHIQDKRDRLAHKQHMGMYSSPYIVERRQTLRKPMAVKK